MIQALRQAARPSTVLLCRPTGLGRPRLLLPWRTASRPRHPGCRGFSSSGAQHEAAAERRWSTPLAKQLAEAISATGPVPVASYMRMCLTSDLGGYYTGALDKTGRDPFGRAGDFVTSPEVSQVFGELVGIWFVAEWMAQGRPSRGVELIEVGPGRGTLMDDILRTVRHFGLAQSIESVYMVEASPQLRLAQKTLLCGHDVALTESSLGYHGVSKHGSLPIVWTETIQSIPQSLENMSFIVAHEFFDALPIHVFQSVAVPAGQGSSTEGSSREIDTTTSTIPSSSTITTSTTTSTTSTTSSTTTSPIPSSTCTSSNSSSSHQWREMVVSSTPPGSTHDSLRTPPSQQRDGPPPDFQLTLSTGATRHSRYLPQLSPRYQALAAIPGVVVEVCPDAALYATDFAVRIGGSAARPRPHPAGAALILDYGPGDGTVPINSLRGIRRHRRVSPFAEPGLTDLSADVDFGAIVEAAVRASDRVELHGPVDQADFLLQMGIRERAQALAAKAAASPAASSSSTPSDIDRSWKRLVDRGPGGMGKVYKVLAILPENDGRRRPVGFGGDVAQ
ncbi:duf185 domain containing protein [Grosmannia clavigera kw1407]|uniref:Protein arginine methyltransferase NDUFAF7 n=1 Tax=Grosmannia clavigera (strain kw1407 / UAMH 11150) TaxID=655863 RepID=F0XUP8_GROCL|nr:duf185 domain containing protein [Grosmannia clavigera kw1407]EFW98946.1 duf185 domain containing protein [Grosmannia clavigera kw1407]